MSNEKLAEALRALVSGWRWAADNAATNGDNNGSAQLRILSEQVERVLSAHAAGAALTKIGDFDPRDSFTVHTDTTTLQRNGAESAQAYETMTPRELAKRVERGEKWTLAGEAAQAQAQSGEWVMVPREPTKAMIEASCKIKLGRLEALRDGHGASSGVASAVREDWAVMLAAAPQQAAEPVAVIESAEDRHGPYLTHANVVLRVWNGYAPKAGDEIYTHPQPSQGALGAVLEVALSIMDANDPLNAARLRKMRDAAMAKESGNG